MSLARILAATVEDLTLPPEVLVLTLGVIAMATVCWLRLLRPRRDGGIPRAPASAIEASGALLASDAPAKLLGLWRACGSPPVFRLPLPQFAPFYCVGDPALARAVLMHPTADKPTKFYASSKGLTSFHGTIFTKPSDASWRWARKGVVPAFRKEHLARMRTVCERHVAHWCATFLGAAAAAGQPVDVCHEVLRVTLRIICEAAFEYAVSDAEMDAFLADLNLTVDEYLVRQELLPLRKELWRLFPAAREAARAAERNMAFAQRVLDAYRAIPAEQRQHETVVSLIDSNTHYASDRERCADVLTFLIAGHDTTSYTVCWALLDMANNPHEAKRLREALRGAENPVDCPALADVVRESMRLNAVAAIGSLRRLSRDLPVPVTTPEANSTSTDITPAGQHQVIPAGADVLVPFHLLHHHSALGDPDTFHPARWREDKTKASDHFIPFALGARNCVGQALATSEVYAMVAHLCADYEWQCHTPGTPHSSLTHKPSGARLIPKKVKAS